MAILSMHAILLRLCLNYHMHFVLVIWIIDELSWQDRRTRSFFEMGIKRGSYSSTKKFNKARVSSIISSCLGCHREWTSWLLGLENWSCEKVQIWSLKFGLPGWFLFPIPAWRPSFFFPLGNYCRHLRKMSFFAQYGFPGPSYRQTYTFMSRKINNLEYPN